MLVHWVVTSLRTPLEYLNFHRLTSSCLAFNCISLPCHISLLTAPKDTNYLSPSTCCVGAETYVSSGFIPAQKVSNPQVFILVIFNYHKCFSLTIRRLSALLIHLFIQFSMNHSITLQYILNVTL